jgi:ribonuclease III
LARGRDIKGLEQALGYTFKSRQTLDRALTHSSTRSDRKVAEDNERLEFLGDRVLGLAIAELLVEREPAATEGILARRFNRLVKRETCALVGRNLNIGRALRLSQSEEESGGRNKDTILADAVEALLGAIFLEAGFETVREVVRQLWAPLLDGLPDMVTDAKSALQEWAQGQGLALPQYVETQREGPDHAPVFTTEVRIAGKVPTRGSGASKRQAEQSAAAALLIREGVWRPKGP